MNMKIVIKTHTFQRVKPNLHFCDERINAGARRKRMQ